MKNKITLFIFILAVCVATNSYSQTTDSLKARCFHWATPVMVDRELIGVEEFTDVCFFGYYKVQSFCYFEVGWKYSPEVFLFKYMKDGFGYTFLTIQNADMFNSKQDELLKLIDKKIQKDYQALLSDPDAKDCIAMMEKPAPCKIDNLQLIFTEKQIFFSYNFGMGTACNYYNYSGAGFSWNDIQPYLKIKETVTPNYCTPSGPKVNVRSESNVKATVNFQLDKGEFFEILEEGKTDIVNGKNGKWYKINYNGKEGYIFSFYTLCP